jgi:hypothetical protein
MGSARPVRRFNALRAHSLAGLPAAEAAGGPPCAFAPLQRTTFEVPPGPADPKAGMSDPTPSPGLCDPTALSRGGGPVCRARLPPHTRAESGVWLPPSRLSPPLLPAREAPERPWASPFKVFSSSRQAPLSGALPSWRYRVRSHRGVRLFTADFRASISRRERSVVGLRRTRPSLPSWDSPLQSFHLIRSGMRFGRAAGPPTHSAGRRPGPPGSQGFAKRMNRLGPSPDCRLSWGSLPFDRRGTPFAGSGGGLMDSPRARLRVCAEPRALSPLDADATRGPDP